MGSGSGGNVLAALASVSDIRETEAARTETVMAQEILDASGVQGRQEFYARHDRHVPIGQNQIRVFGLGDFEGFLAVFGLHDVMTGEASLPDRPRDDAAHGPRIVYDQNFHYALLLRWCLIIRLRRGKFPPG